MENMVNNTLKNIKIYERSKIIDERGWFLKVIDGSEYNINGEVGEFYFTCAKPNQCKGGHYHKIANEWFSLIVGKAVLKLQDVQTGETLEIALDASKPVTVYVPSYVAHVFVNKHDEDFILCAYSDYRYDQSDTIIYKIE